MRRLASGVIIPSGTMPDQPIELVAHDPIWRDSFLEQKSTLTSILQPWLAGAIEHFGSTAVADLRAKPIIDILAPVRSLESARDAIPLLEADGWLHWADDPKRHQRLWFLRPRPEARTHHLHVIEDPNRIATLLRFRDALRADENLRREYETLKLRLAQQHHLDREAYTEAKTEFIERALRKK
jgi:GrpB-like predicted nucleotidyltransferase (UPF0157 family)